MKVNKNQPSNTESPEIAAMLDATAWTHEFSWSQLLVLSHYFELCQIPASCLIYDEGDAGDAMALLIKGLAEISKQGKTLAQLKPGRTFGEMSLLDGQPRSASVIAVKECLYLKMTRSHFNALIQEHPALAVKLLLKIGGLLSQALRLTSGQLCETLID